MLPLKTLTFLKRHSVVLDTDTEIIEKEVVVPEFTQILPTIRKYEEDNPIPELPSHFVVHPQEEKALHAEFQIVSQEPLAGLIMSNEFSNMKTGMLEF